MASSSTTTTTTTTETTKKILLKGSDGKEFEIDEKIALESQTIKFMIEDDCANNLIPLPNVTGTTLSKVIEYCKKHAENNKNDSSSPEDDRKLKEYDAEFVKVEKHELFDLVVAANYLNIESLLELTCQAVADMIKDMTVEEVRDIFNIKNDFTPEEEEEARREHPWAHE